MSDDRRALAEKYRKTMNADTRALAEALTEAENEVDRWRKVAEYGWHLHNYGENAPGGTETWREFEALIRAAADGGTPQ